MSDASAKRLNSTFRKFAASFCWSLLFFVLVSLLVPKDVLAGAKLLGRVVSPVGAAASCPADYYYFGDNCGVDSCEGPPNYSITWEQGANSNTVLNNDCYFDGGARVDRPRYTFEWTDNPDGDADGEWVTVNLSIGGEFTMGSWSLTTTNSGGDPLPGSQQSGTTLPAVVRVYDTGGYDWNHLWFYDAEPESWNHTPEGYFDGADCNNFWGWARDPDTTSPIDVHFYADGPAGVGTYLGSALANQYRSDLCNAWENGNADCYHGFEFPTPASLKDGNSHGIYVYAIDSEGGTNPLLGGSPKTINCAPIGNPPTCSDFSVNGVYGPEPVSITQGDTVTLRAFPSDPDNDLNRVEFWYVPVGADYCAGLAVWDLIGRDYSSSGGWTVGWGTSGVSPGEYYIAGNVYDDTDLWCSGNPWGTCGSTATTCPGCRVRVEIVGAAVPCPATPPSYPANRWDRVWCDRNFGTRLADTPDESNIQFDNNWGTGTVGGIRADDIGFRSGRTINLPTAGTYTFTLGSDDGARLWIDGTLRINRWFDTAYSTSSVDVDLTAGNHTFRIDYYENAIDARVSFSYTAPSELIDMTNYWPLQPCNFWEFDGTTQGGESFVTRIEVEYPQTFCGESVYPIRFTKDKKAGYWGPEHEKDLRWYVTTDFVQRANWPHEYLFARGGSSYQWLEDDPWNLGGFIDWMGYQSAEPDKYPAYRLYPRHLDLNWQFDDINLHATNSCEGGYSIGWKLSYEAVSVDTPDYSGPAIKVKFREGEVPWGAFEDWYFADGVGVVMIDVLQPVPVTLKLKNYGKFSSECRVENACRASVAMACTADDARDNDISDGVDDRWCTWNVHDDCRVKSGVQIVNGQVNPPFWEGESCGDDPGTSILCGEKKVYVDDISKYSIKARAYVDDSSWVFVLKDGGWQEVPELHRDCCGWTDWQDITSYFKTGWNTIKFSSEDTCSGERYFNLDWDVSLVTLGCPSAPPSYPTVKWNRVWCDRNFGTRLADHPDESNTQFDNNWSTGAVGGIRADDIGFRSGRTINLPTTGTYTFTLGSDDGARLWIDDNLQIDRWYDTAYSTTPKEVYLTAGNHEFRIDYYENTGDARVSFSYTAPSVVPGISWFRDKEYEAMIAKLNEFSARYGQRTIQDGDDFIQLRTYADMAMVYAAKYHETGGSSAKADAEWYWDKAFEKVKVLNNNGWGGSTWGMPMGMSPFITASALLEHRGNDVLAEVKDAHDQAVAQFPNPLPGVDYATEAETNAWFASFYQLADDFTKDTTFATNSYDRGDLFAGHVFTWEERPAGPDTEYGGIHTDNQDSDYNPNTEVGWANTRMTWNRGSQWPTPNYQGAGDGAAGFLLHALLSRGMGPGLRLHRNILGLSSLRHYVDVNTSSYKDVGTNSGSNCSPFWQHGGKWISEWGDDAQYVTAGFAFGLLVANANGEQGWYNDFGAVYEPLILTSISNPSEPYPCNPADCDLKKLVWAIMIESHAKAYLALSGWKIPEITCLSTQINGGAAYTRFQSVTLSLSACNVTDMRFRNEGGSWSGWESYVTPKSWTLSGGADGQRQVTVQYRGAGETSDPSNPACSDTIILDTTAPDSSIDPLPSCSPANPLHLSWSGTDNLASTADLRYYVQYKEDEGSWTDLLGSELSPTSDTSYNFSGTEGKKYCFRVKARDPAGNWEAWPATPDTCTTTDTGIEMFNFGYEENKKHPDVWVTIFDDASGINFDSIHCWYSEDGGTSWNTYTCTYDSTQDPKDPLSVTMKGVPFSTHHETKNKVRFKACDSCGNCTQNIYTVDNQVGSWVETFGGDIHSNASILFGYSAEGRAHSEYIASARGSTGETTSGNDWVLPYYVEGDISGDNTPIAAPTYEELLARFGVDAQPFTSPLPDVSPLPTSSGVWHTTGDVTVNDPLNFPKNCWILIFIDKTLTIKAEITIPQSSAVAFIAKEIKFAKDLGGTGGIDYADGLYIAEGKIDTAYDISVPGEVTNRLITNGSLISLKGTISLHRALSPEENIQHSSEQINLEPKYYLLLNEYIGGPQVSWGEVAP